MSPQEILSESVLACRMLTERHLAGFNSMNHTRQSEHLPGHIAWILGHCALVMHRAAEHLDGKPIPETDFSDTPCITATDDPTFCYHNESIGTESDPMDDPAIYPSFERCVQIYETACARLAAAVRNAGRDDLLRAIEWEGDHLPLWMVVQRVIFQNGMHAGQIIDLRRAMGMSLVPA